MTTTASGPRWDVCPTGVPGLDSILAGGLPRDRLYLVHGDPGVGKTTLALQFLLEGARRRETCLYITLSESEDELQAVAASHGWDLQAIGIFALSTLTDRLQDETESTFFRPSEIELGRTTKTLVDEVVRTQPARIVIDSLSELRMLAETPLRYRRQILQLKQFFAGVRSTVLMLDDRSVSSGDLQIESLAHGVIGLHRSTPEYGIYRRQLTVQKVRGVKFREGSHDLVIQRGGVVVFPRLVAAEHHVPFAAETISSGVQELDSLLGAGVDRGTSTMFMGPPGTGKSTLAIKFAHVAAARGERVLYYSFDESAQTLRARAANLGMPVDALIEEGKVQLNQIDPAEISPGELTHRIREGVEQSGVRMVVIDSINGYLKAMPEERYLSLQLHELLAFLNQQGIVTIIILAQQGLIGTMQSSVDLTYLADTVLLLRYFEAQGAVKQAVSVIKKRSGNHERTIREISVGPSGISVGPPLTNFHGVLTGVPDFRGPAVSAAPL